MKTRHRTRLRRDLQAIVGDGIAFSVMVGVGESFLAAFVLAAGHGEIAAGLVATLPMLVGSIFQLLTPAGVDRLGSHRRWVVLCAVGQAASFGPLIVGALAGRISLAWVFLAATVYWGSGMATSPAWNTWVGTLVPARIRGRFFAARARSSQIALFLAVLAGGALLHAGEGSSRTLPSFAALFALAAAARLVSSRFLAAQSEPQPRPAGHRSVTLREFLERVLQGPEGRLLRPLLAMQLAVNVAAPFFTPFMLGPLGLSYALFTTFTAASFVGRVVALPALGHVAARVGAHRLLWAGAAGVVPLPALWLVSRNVGYLLGLQLAAGVAWSAFELAVLLSTFDRVPEHERTSILSYFNFANAVFVALGSVVGSLLFRALDPHGLAWVVIFVVSSAGRALALALFSQLPAITAPEAPIGLRTLAVRPSVGAIQRPILPGLPPPHPPSPAAEPESAPATAPGAGEAVRG